MYGKIWIIYSQEDNQTSLNYWYLSPEPFLSPRIVSKKECQIYICVDENYRTSNATTYFTYRIVSVNCLFRSMCLQ